MDPLASALERAFPGDWSPERVDAFREACELCYGGEEEEGDGDDEETPAGRERAHPAVMIALGKMRKK